MEPYNPSPMQGTCPICWQDSSTDPDTVSHSGRRAPHPVHKRCIKEWLKNYDYCPICYTQVDKDSIFSWVERCLRQVKNIGTDLLGCQAQDANAVALAALEEAHL